MDFKEITEHLHGDILTITVQNINNMPSNQGLMLLVDRSIDQSINQSINQYQSIDLNNVSVFASQRKQPSPD